MIRCTRVGIEPGLRVLPRAEETYHPAGTDTTLPTQVDIVLTPIVAYNVDVVHTRSAEVMSAHS